MRKKQLWGNQGPHLSHRVPRTWASAQVRSSLLICSVPWKLEMGDRAGPSDDTQGSIPMFLLQNVAEPQKAATFFYCPFVWTFWTMAYGQQMQSKWSQKALTNLPFGLPRWHFPNPHIWLPFTLVICVIPFRLMSTGKNIPALFYQPASTSHL